MEKLSFILLFTIILLTASSHRTAPLFLKDSLAYAVEIAPYAEEYVIPEQCFNVYLENFGNVNIISTLDKSNGRIALYFTDYKSGAILYKTDYIECNSWYTESLEQPNIGIAALAFRDLNADNLTDIIIISECEVSGNYFKICDVLFQHQEGFYSDWAITDTLNRYSMNKNVEMISDYVKGNRSAIFLYTANTLTDLTANGFIILDDYCRDFNFEYLGKTRVITGFYAMGGLRRLMVYIVSNDEILWRFQPMQQYDNFAQILSIAIEDIDQSGQSDIILLSQYNNCAPSGMSAPVDICSIYFQNNRSFYINEALIEEMKVNSNFEDMLIKSKSYFKR